MDDRDIDEFWRDYNSLSTREQIRRHGFSQWTTASTKGVLLTIAAWLALLWALTAVLG